MLCVIAILFVYAFIAVSKRQTFSLMVATWYFILPNIPAKFVTLFANESKQFYLPVDDDQIRRRSSNKKAVRQL